MLINLEKNITCFLCVLKKYLAIFMKNYVTISELTKIYSVSQQTVDMILKKHKIDSYKSKKWLAIHLKDFHKIYTAKYNPSLFIFDEKNTKKWNLDNMTNIPKFTDDESLFLYVFSKPIFNNA